jgi:hypothetical protein
MGEQIGAFFVFAGLATSMAGLLWGAFRGIGVILRRRDFRRMLAPVVLVGIGLLVGAVPLAAQRVYLALVGLGPRQRVLAEGRVLNLTGWDRGDYSLIAMRPDVAILEIGNADVDDDTLDLLAALPQLRELTLNDSAITDTGLAKLSRLPKLETLRIARTQVTSEGVRRFLDAPPPQLRQIDVSGNDVPTAILRRWKNASGDTGGERRYVN